jgi:uncharacterized membrane protein
MGENGFAPMPTAVYGFVLLMAAIAYLILERAIIAREGRDSLLARAVGGDWKGKLSAVLYFAAIPLAFVSPWIAGGLYVFVALWLIPDLGSSGSWRTAKSNQGGNPVSVIHNLRRAVIRR